MPNTQGLRRRIKSISNTRQITKAMEMVAASKMRRAQEATLKTRAYAHQALALLTNLSGRVNKELHPLLDERDVKSILAIIVTSDKGLCGGYNGQVLRTAGQFLRENEGKNIDIITIGKRGQNFLKRFPVNIVATFNDFPTYPTSLDANPIAKLAIEGFMKGQYDQVVLVFTEFVSTLRQVPTAKPILPLSLIKISELLEETIEEQSYTYEYVYEPGTEKVLEYILPRLTEAQVFHTILESIASEHSARMMAMRSATDNASELIDDLTLTYNSMRQASITQELAEVNAGTEALKER